MPFSSTQPSLRARVLSKFPARVLAGSGMVINKSGGTYTFSASAIPISALDNISTDRLLGRDTAGTGGVEQLTLSSGLGFTGAGGIQMTTNQRIDFLRYTLFQNGAVLTTGIKGDLSVPYSATIASVTLLADQSGSIVVDIWKDSYANYPPTVADTITAAAKPTISATTKYTDSTLTGWTTALTAGDTLRFNIDSVSTVTRVEITLGVVKV